jgi:hypothetical protein
MRAILASSSLGLSALPANSSIVAVTSFNLHAHALCSSQYNNGVSPSAQHMNNMWQHGMYCAASQAEQ